MSNDKSLSLFDPALVRPAVLGAFTSSIRACNGATP
jgi:hypothetical protein